ncbi:MAG: tetratricopeptide repeat protein [Desulfuromonadales bacterium]|nr:tetratricopeptide repeat protein [Desulfuromonadales bacterium]MBN2791250.1 tetratricopeptide repeat protein [Desulfuromonadales bacterium]
MLEPGAKFDRYEIVEALPVHNVYQSYLVHGAGDGAVKLLVFERENLFQTISRRQFIEQAQWLSSQDFPGVGLPLDTGEYEEQLYCLFPCVPGATLAVKFDQFQTVRHAVELLKNITESLIAPHAAGLVHGNLSPETISLVDAKPFLADFALSRLVKLDYQSGVDAHYTSPEQVRGDAVASPADIYSLGCVFYRLLTATPPYCGDGPFAVALQHVQGDFPALPNALSICRPLLEAMTKTSPGERISAAVLHRECEQLLAKESLDIPTAGPEMASDGDDQVTQCRPADSASVTDGDLATRIEARLKEHVSNLNEPVLSGADDVPLTDATEELEHIYSREDSPVWRYLLILLVGIAIGSGGYFLFLNQPAPEKLESPPKNPRDISADLDQALLSWQNSAHPEAVNLLMSLVSEFPEDPRAYNNLAVIYAAQGDYEQARDYLERALSTDADYVTVYNNLGALYAEMARHSYGKALQLDEVGSLLTLQALSSRGAVRLTAAGQAEPVTSQENGRDDGVAEVSSIETPAVRDDVQSPVSEAMAVAKVDAQESAEVGSDGAAAVTEIQEGEAAQPEIAAVEPIAEDEPSANVPDSVEKESAEDFIRRWAQAWSDQDVVAYLSFYDPAFVPSGGKTRAAWEAQRKQRISRPQSIEVSLTDIRLSGLGDDKIRIEAVQHYKSDLYSDQTRKIFDLQEHGAGWSILSERSLGSLR